MSSSDFLSAPVAVQFAIGLGLYFASLIAVSRYFAKRMSGLSSFFLADRDLPTWVLLVAFLAAWLGAASTMGTMTKAYQNGLSAAWYIAIPAVVSCLVQALLLARQIRASGYESMPEAVAARYGPGVSALFAGVILFASVPFMGSQFYATGQIFQSVIGLSPAVSIPVVYAIIVIYSIIGGFRSVVLTDVVQCLVLFTGLASLLVFVATHASYAPVVASPPAHYFDLGQDLGANLAMTLTFCLGWMIAPELWQRVAALRSDGQARRLVLWAAACFPFVYATVMAIGMLAFSVVNPATFPKDGNLFITLALMMPPGLGTIVLIALMAAIASTIDTTLNVACMTLSKDILSQFFLKQLSGAQQVALSRVGTVLIGLPAMAVALFYHDIIHILWISADIFASCLFVPIVGVFYVKAGHGHAKSATLAILLGLIPVLLNFAGDMKLLSLPTYWPAYPYTTLLGVGLSALGFALGALWHHQAQKSTILSCGK